MTRVLKVAVLALVLIFPANAWGDYVPILEFTPVGDLDITPSHNISSITLFPPGVGQVTTPLTLQGALTAEVVGALNSAYIAGLAPQTTAGALVGLDGATAVLGLGGDPASALAAWFANPVTGDGDNDTAEIFIVDWGASLDNFQVQLLTSDAAAGIAGAVVATTVQVSMSDQIQTTTFANNIPQSPVDQFLAGVGINLDNEGLGGAEILGVLIPADDGSGGLSGVDPTIIAAVGPAATPGDFDFDGDVDGKDFLTWQRGNGIVVDIDTGNGAAYVDGDADLNGAVDGSDFAIWEGNYGPSAVAAVSTVPEPSTLLLVAVGAIAGLLRRRDGNC